MNARLPLPVNLDQSRLYRAIFDELGANGTVALRVDSLTSLIDSASGKELSYDEFDKSEQYIGMSASTANGKTTWKSYWESEKVYTVCEKISCQSAQSKSAGNMAQAISFLLNT